MSITVDDTVCRFFVLVVVLGNALFLNILLVENPKLDFVPCGP